MSATVLIAAPEHLAALKERSDLSGALAVPDTDALQALDTITRQRRSVVALEQLFAGTSRGAAFINRIKADPALASCEIRIVAPRALMPEAGEFVGCERFTAIDGGITGVDVIMMLRIQKERMATAQIPDADRYFAKYGLSAERLAKAKPDAIVMHPQPMNRGIEIASDIADGPQSVIRDQVRNGVAVRMAVLEAVIEGPN